VTLSERALREPLRRALAARTPRKIPFGKRAAVLLPLFEKEGDTRVWLLRRPATMRAHAGQVAFPGGKPDPSDASLEATALREAHEELGVEPAEVDVLGPLDDYLTITGYAITPYVGWIGPSVPIVPNEQEVARAFTAPLGTFLAPPTGFLHLRGYEVDGETVWGATAAIARGLGEIVRRVV
jgi:8-oxo-dGTP pyrophosphatase MutT (NUDIX family)